MFKRKNKIIFIGGLLILILLGGIITFFVIKNKKAEKNEYFNIVYVYGPKTEKGEEAVERYEIIMEYNKKDFNLDMLLKVEEETFYVDGWFRNEEFTRPVSLERLKTSNDINYLYGLFVKREEKTITFKLGDTSVYYKVYKGWEYKMEDFEIDFSPEYKITGFNLDGEELKSILVDDDVLVEVLYELNEDYEEDFLNIEINGEFETVSNGTLFSELTDYEIGDYFNEDDEYFYYINQIVITEYDYSGSFEYTEDFEIKRDLRIRFNFEPRKKINLIGVDFFEQTQLVSEKNGLIIIQENDLEIITGEDYSGKLLLRYEDKTYNIKDEIEFNQSDYVEVYKDQENLLELFKTIENFNNGYSENFTLYQERFIEILEGKLLLETENYGTIKAKDASINSVVESNWKLTGDIYEIIEQKVGLSSELATLGNIIDDYYSPLTRKDYNYEIRKNLENDLELIREIYKNYILIKDQEHETVETENFELENYFISVEDYEFLTNETFYHFINPFSIKEFNFEFLKTHFKNQANNVYEFEIEYDDQTNVLESIIKGLITPQKEEVSKLIIRITLNEDDIKINIETEIIKESLNSLNHIGIIGLDENTTIKEIIVSELILK